MSHLKEWPRSRQQVSQHWRQLRLHRPRLIGSLRWTAGFSTRKLKQDVFCNKRDSFFHTIWGSFLCRHDYDVNFPDALFYGGRRNRNKKTNFISLSKLECGVNNSIPGEFGHI